jgi:hypothetical protein
MAPINVCIGTDVTQDVGGKPVTSGNTAPAGVGVSKVTRVTRPKGARSVAIYLETNFILVITGFRVHTGLAH